MQVGKIILKGGGEISVRSHSGSNQIYFTLLTKLGEWDITDEQALLLSQQNSWVAFDIRGAKCDHYEPE
jgi:hypothetical protein